MADSSEIIRPEAVELLRRIDNPEELPHGLGDVTAEGRFLETEERDLLKSVTFAEVQAAAAQVRLDFETKIELVSLHRRIAAVLNEAGAGDLTAKEALPLMRLQQRVEFSELLDRASLLALLVDPTAKSGADMAQAYLAGRLSVGEWSSEGEPLSFRDADSQQPAPTMAEAIRVLVALVGPDAAEAQLGTAPPEWQDSWTKAALVGLFEQVANEGVAAGWLVDNGDGAFRGDTKRWVDEVRRRLEEGTGTAED